MLFLSQIKELPAPYSAERVQNGLQEWHDRAAASGDAGLTAFARHVSQNRTGKAFLAAVFGNSPFLSQCLFRDMGFARDLFEQGPTELWPKLRDSIADTALFERPLLMTALRETRTKVALLVAAADIAGVWSLEEITHVLSRFADGAIDTTVAHLLATAAKAGELNLSDPLEPCKCSGFTIIGMGKLGACELNYSSDIDLIALFDEEAINYSGEKTAQECYVRLTRDLVQILQSRTADGYVFRTDLRLRPDTGNSLLAMSMGAAESYYESVGQNWERAALIKARPVAGDLAAGREFLDRISPFIWRKYLDYAAIEDIHSIKRQIHAHRGHGAVTVPGHNVKVGRGGIREIEFFAQTQQLIAGGRDPSLRISDTRGTLEALVASGRLDRSVADDLEQAYEFLRRLEHRLQMIGDEQTHTLPENESGLAHIASFMGFADSDAFTSSTLNHLLTIERHYARLFEHAPELGDAGNLVFTGTEDDPETIATLNEFGYSEPSTTAALIRNWHHGRYRAMRSARARELLTELTPTLLKAFASTTNPDSAVLKFDEFLAKLPAGIQIFSLFYANPGLLDLVAEIMGSAPKLAEHLARNPRLLDNVLGSKFYDPLPDVHQMTAELHETLEDANYYEEALDASRQWGHDQMFQAGVQILRNITNANDVGPRLADVADVLVQALLVRTEAEFARAHGQVEDGGFAIIALGKYGAQELTPESDLDLTFVYNCPPDTKFSHGDRPLMIGEYYSRLSKRVINALSALTSEGRLYDVDMRLRPSGSSGPIAVHIDGFRDYQNSRAWTWEHMALTRARVVAAPTQLKNRIEDTIDSVLGMRRDSEKLLMDVAEMRERIDREHGIDDPWQVKHVRGGLVDLEFICQFFILRYASQHPSIAVQNSASALHALSDAGIIDSELSDELAEATILHRNVQGFLRQTLQTAFIEDSAPQGLREALAGTTGSKNFEALKYALLDTERRVFEHYQKLIGRPALKFDLNAKKGTE